MATITADIKDSVFNTLAAVDAKKRVDKKDGLSYLRWGWAWAEVKKRYPDAHYTIYKDENGRPYVNTPAGYIVYTSVTIKGETLDMWLPVMNGSNKAMGAEPYTYTVKKYGKEETKTVERATMFDINKALMRCLVKNIAMFGLGLSLYVNGKDILEMDDEELQEVKEKSRAEKSKKKAEEVEKVPTVKTTKKTAENAKKSAPTAKELRAELITLAKPRGPEFMAEISKAYNLTSGTVGAFTAAIEYVKGLESEGK